MSVLTGKIREAKGKSAARKLRTDECVPAVLYGLKDNFSLSVNPKELNKLIEAKGRNVLIELKVDGDSAGNRNVILKEFQTHPLKQGLIHVDFLEIDITKKIKVKIPVLAINGEKDLQVPPKENLSEIKAALQRGENKNYEIHELKDLNHNN